MKPNLTLGERIKQMRKRNGITQSRLGGLAGLTGDWICNIECGRRKPNVTTLSSIARALGVTTDFLIGQPVRNNHKKPATQRKANGKN